MGKGAILLVLAAIYGWTMTVSNKKQVYLEREDEQALYEESVLARERALSGFDIVVAGTEDDFTNFRPDGTTQSYRDGSFTYSAVRVAGAPTVEMGLVENCRFSPCASNNNIPDDPSPVCEWMPSPVVA